jgi:hypothetical protein
MLVTRTREAPSRPLQVLIWRCLTLKQPIILRTLLYTLALKIVDAWNFSS